MDYIKQNFSIKDLENLSGIKAHTIRIWEKRYNLLSPDRTSTNIRTYDNSNLQKILNVAFLNENGYKISRISKLSDEEISDMVKKVNASSSVESRAINHFKMAMLNFDEAAFNDTFHYLKQHKSFREIFHETFIPLLDQIGMLWQTSTIKPIHEHFLADLIKQKIYLEIGKEKEEKSFNNEKIYVLFLPENEIHDIGILYLYYELLNHNHKTIYLGPSLPLSDIQHLLESHKNLIFLTYCTIQPTEVEKYLEEFQEELCKEVSYDLLLFGQKIRELDRKNLPSNIKAYNSITAFTQTL